MMNLHNFWMPTVAARPGGQTLVRNQAKIRNARFDPNAFIEWSFTDPQGQPLQQSGIHRELQAFLSANRRALVELPRDHGKSTQVCARLVWELARDPSLRIKIVCASEALAAERGRFIRQAIENNVQLRCAFQDLRPAHPWSDTRTRVSIGAAHAKTPGPRRVIPVTALDCTTRSAGPRIRDTCAASREWMRSADSVPGRHFPSYFRPSAIRRRVQRPRPGEGVACA